MNKKRIKLILGIIIAFILIIVLADGLFILHEDESVIIKRFTRIEAIYVRQITPQLLEQMGTLEQKYQNVPIYEGTGLKFKIPILDTVTRHTARLLTYETSSQSIIASDKKTLIFDNNAQWRIDNPLLFDITVGTTATAQDRIDNYIYSHMRERIGKMDSTTLIANKSAVEEMLLTLESDITKDTSAFGVTVIDIRIKRTELPEENSASVYSRMRTERNRIAAQYRSEGEEQSIQIRSQTDREVTIITSEAYKEAEILKGEGDSEAARIYNDAYGRNPDFFEFYNMLETYRQTIGKSTTLVIPSNSVFARYLLGSE